MRIHTLLAGLVLATTSSAQLAITEILIDPVGPDVGNQLIEITNVGQFAMPISGWNICVPLSYALIPSMTIQPAQTVTLHVAASGTNTPTDVFMPFLTPLNKPSDAVLLYKSGSFTNSADIVDYVSWGGSTLRAGQAVSVGQWPFVGATVPGPFVEGHSIVGDGAGNSPDAWFHDATPTLGVANNSHTTISSGFACATSTGLPEFSLPTAGVDGNLDFVFRVSGGPVGAPVALLVGVPSGGLPFMGCSVEVSIVFVTLSGLMDGSGVFDSPLSLNVPNVPGFQAEFQGVVVDSAAPNGSFGMTDGSFVIFAN